MADEADPTEAEEAHEPEEPVSEDELRERLDDLLERSRDAGEKLFAEVGRALDGLRGRVGEQLGRMGLVTKEDLARVERKIDDLAASAGPGTAEPAVDVPAASAEEQAVSAKKASPAGKKAGKPKAAKKAATGKSGKSSKKPAGKKPAGSA